MSFPQSLLKLCDLVGQLVELPHHLGFVALLTGALAQRFLYGGSASATPKPDPDEVEMMRKLDELSHQVAELQKALRERHG